MLDLGMPACESLELIKCDLWISLQLKFLSVITEKKHKKSIIQTSATIKLVTHTQE